MKRPQNQPESGNIVSLAVNQHGRNQVRLIRIKYTAHPLAAILEAIRLSHLLTVNVKTFKKGDIMQKNG
ncbi:hypothetical protein FRX31_012442 [Thalictrum thalictroides]|uniref:Uncharacterized protein n=1 Tax=Thalictrum thalictroides TaxID=46969 RepID=A0A7J6WKR6_THATH|nr:hypothetical protein FRX31_012442 [Thalictrum thalictroides]